MLRCEGYKMFYGEATITPGNPKYPPQAIIGTWLYRPDNKTWSVNGHSYAERLVSDFHEVNPTAASQAWDDMFSDALDELDDMCAMVEAAVGRKASAG